MVAKVLMWGLVVSFPFVHQAVAGKWHNNRVAAFYVFLLGITIMEFVF